MNEKAIVRVSVNGQGVLGRRGFLKALGLGAVGAGALSFGDLMAVHAEELRKRQMACILLWMSGGPSQFETFDPKPEHSNGGETKAIETSVPGISIAEGWDQTAKVMDEIALVRSMTNKEGNHQRATYHLHTGYVPSGTVKHPHFGCNVVSELADPDFDLPHMVSVGAAGPRVPGAGFLGVDYEPFAVGNPMQPPANVELPVPRDRFSRRLGLLGALEKGGFARSGGADRVEDHSSLYRQTSDMILSPRMKAFDLEQEDSPVRDAYGRSSFGQGCLLARRLVESGVTFVEVASGGWDMHQRLKDNMAKHANEVDPAFATLITDLKQRGMLERTLVIWMGEFGRTPKPNARGGRDHFPRVFNLALAGAGVQGGQVIGSSSADGSEVKDRPVGVTDLMNTFCHALKIDPTRENMTPVGRPIKVVDGGKPVLELFA